MQRRKHVTWVVVGAVVVLLVAAGVDALRSSPHSATVAPGTTVALTTTTQIATGTPPCARHDLRILIKIREEVASVIVRNIGADACHRVLRGWHLRIEDRAGKVVGEWAKEQVPVQPLIVGDFRAGDEVAFWLPQGPVLCDSSGPYLALATVGPYSARLDDLPPRAITCI